MKMAWFLMIWGAFWIIQGIAIFFVGLNPPNFWIMLCGVCLGFGLGVYPGYQGFKKRRELLKKV